MATIDSRKYIDEIIAAKGVLYPDDPNEPPVVKIVEYTNAWGKVTWGVIFKDVDPLDKYRETEFVRNPKTIWEVER